jgi:hypothetical protein
VNPKAKVNSIAAWSWIRVVAPQQKCAVRILIICNDRTTRESHVVKMDETMGESMEATLCSGSQIGLHDRREKLVPPECLMARSKRFELLSPYS